MNPQPTGRVRKTERGTELILTRTFRAPIDDVWESVTRSESTARWFGAWTGEPGPGKSIKVQMAYEEGMPWMDILIDVCEPPRRLVVTSTDSYGKWHLELTLAATGDTTVLTFTQHQLDPAQAGEIGPGWEYYLDRLVAARLGEPARPFEDYYPAQRDHYRDAAGSGS